MRSTIVNVILSVEDILKSKGIIFIKFNTDLSNSDNVVREARKHRYCKGINGYILIDGHDDTLCLVANHCASGHISVNMNSKQAPIIKSIIIDPLREAGINIMDAGTNTWYFHPHTIIEE